MKLLFTDIDGTLLRSDNTISEPLREGLHAMAKNGHGFILSSGRPLSSILGVLDYLNIPFEHAYVIANNGGLIYDCLAQKNIFEKRFPLSLVDPVQAAAAEHKLHIQTYTSTHVVTPSWNEAIDSYVERIKVPAICSPKLSDALTEAPFKMLAINLHEPEKLHEFQEYIRQTYPDQLQTMFSNPFYLELIHKDASKGNALRYLCDHLQVPISDSIAAGDSENDLSMLSAAGHSYAMANAKDKIKSSADSTTTLDHDHDGMLEILKSHFL